MSEFRNDIAVAAHEHVTATEAFAVADAVLAMPEMQAIRAWILQVGLDGTDDNWPLRRVLGGLPDSVIAWVLDGEA